MRAECCFGTLLIQYARAVTRAALWPPFAGTRTVTLDNLLPDYEAAFASVAPEEEVTLATFSGRNISAARQSIPFPNGTVFHAISWRAVDMMETQDGRTPYRAKAQDRADQYASMNIVDAEGTVARSERSSRASKSVAMLFRKALLAGRTNAPPPLRKLKLMGLVVGIIIIIAAIVLIEVALSSLSALTSSAQLASSGANRWGRGSSCDGFCCSTSAPAREVRIA